MTQKQIDTFEKVQLQLEGLHFEISALSKKSQNDALNKFKLRFVNQILKAANGLLVNSYKPFPEFDLFTEDEMPTTSDVTMMLTQYLSCIERLKADNIVYAYPSWYWIIDGRISNIKTIEPKKK